MKSHMCMGNTSNLLHLVSLPRITTVKLRKNARSPFLLFLTSPSSHFAVKIHLPMVQCTPSEVFFNSITRSMQLDVWMKIKLFATFVTLPKYFMSHRHGCFLSMEVSGTSILETAGSNQCLRLDLEHGPIQSRNSSRGGHYSGKDREA